MIFVVPVAMGDASCVGDLHDLSVSVRSNGWTWSCRESGLNTSLETSLA